ncbi:MAG: nucleotidyltransferase domain-containing protein [Chloroflexota bacterium]|nr:nucleotidyltransferase domain-containing protein [Chloroflexota bacterium]
MILDFLPAVTQWASAQPDIIALALVGSYARGKATESSDIDLVILTSNPGRYLDEPGWIKCFGQVEKQQVEDWGMVTSLRVWYADGREVEFGLTTPAWAAHPIDEGTRRVVADGIKVLFERAGCLTSLIKWADSYADKSSSRSS